MIDIERLTLRLPPGYEPRAAAIARELAAALAPLDALAPVALERLDLAPLRAAPGASDRAIGVALAREVQRQVRAQRS
jgi:hypothetical protein